MPRLRMHMEGLGNTATIMEADLGVCVKERNGCTVSDPCAQPGSLHSSNRESPGSIWVGPDESDIHVWESSPSQGRRKESTAAGLLQGRGETCCF